MKPKLKIAIVNRSIYYSGGIEYFGCNLANWLADRGHQVLVLSRPPFEPSHQPVIPLRSEILHCHFTPPDYLSTREILLNFEADLCIAMYSSAEVLFWIQALFSTGIPLLYSERSNPEIIENEWWNRKERQMLLGVSDSIHVMIPEFTQSIPLSLQKRIRIIPHFSRFPTKPPPTATRQIRKILSLGRLDPQKQLHLLISAFELIHSRFPNWKVEIWGAGAVEQSLLEMIIEKKLSHCISLNGETRTPENQFQSADLFCIPSKFEGFGNTVVEAMAHGLPVVGFAECSGVNWIVQDGVNGLLAPEMTAHSLAQALSQLMSDEELRQKMSDAALDRAADFDKETIMSKWEEMIDDCASHKGNTALQRAMAELNDPESHAAHLHLLWRLNATFEERMEYFRYPLVQYVHYKRNKWFIKWPWKLILSLWGVKNRVLRR